MSGFIQVGTLVAASSGTLSVSITGVTGGNQLVCQIGGNWSSAGITLPGTDSQSQAWSTGINTNPGGTNRLNIATFYLLSANAGTHTLGFSVTGSAELVGVISEWNGITAYDTGSTNGNSGSSVASPQSGPSYTPGQANEIVFAQMAGSGISSNDNPTNPPSGGWSALGVENDGATFCINEMCYQIVTSTSTVTGPQWSWSNGSMSFAGQVVGFKYTPVSSSMPIAWWKA